ncbi:MAG: TraR/DksA family transcriptional regulator [Burkholderiaceae bacterium]|nr:TraR/DksA family transcriptional regulator [Burkholderiaceae bacterium]
MSTQITQPFRQQLLAQRASLLDQLSSLRGGAVGRSAASSAHYAEREPDSRAQMSSERELEFTLDARETAELDAIDAALQRIADGVYGICVDCGQVIPVARLHAAPETPRCVACQSQFEKLGRS